MASGNTRSEMERRTMLANQIKGSTVVYLFWGTDQSSEVVDV
jgi:hypothetical protein